MKNKREKIKIGIIGAGPAGLTAALSLTAKGYKVKIFEEHKTIGLPIQCGEGISENVFQDFPFLKENKSFVEKKFTHTKIHFPGENIIYGDTQAYLIKRDKFDQLLAEKVEEKKGEISRETKVLDAEEKEGKVVVQVEKKGERKKETVSILLIAEGPNGKIAKKMGFKTPELIRALEYRIKGEYGETLEFFFNNKKYPFGYAWIFPKKEETNVGIVTTKKNRREILDEFLKEQKIESEIIKKIGGAIPMKGTVKRLASKKVALLGDTGGFTNPLFYGGIRNAMISGKIVAEVIEKQYQKNKKIDLREFEKEIKKHPLTAKISKKCHNYFYSRTEEYQQKLGEIFNGRYINRIEKKEILEVGGKIIKNVKIAKNPRKLYWMYKGFKLARDYGF